MPMGGAMAYEDEVPAVFGEVGDLNDQQYMDADGDLTLDDIELMRLLGIAFPQQRQAVQASQAENPLGLAQALSGEEPY